VVHPCPITKSGVVIDSERPFYFFGIWFAVWAFVPDEHPHVPTVTDIPWVRGQPHTAEESWIGGAESAQQISELVFRVVSRLVETDEAIFLAVVIRTIIITPQVAQLQGGAAIIDGIWNREQ
jgi:hypothetical protein